MSAPVHDIVKGLQRQISAEQQRTAREIARADKAEVLVRQLSVQNEALRRRVGELEVELRSVGISV